MYISGTSQDGMSFRSYRKGTASTRRLSGGDRADNLTNESVKSFRSEDLVISKRMSLDESDGSCSGEGIDVHNRSFPSAKSIQQMPSDDIGDLVPFVNTATLFTINEEDRTKSNLSLGRDSSIMTLDPGLLTARSEKSHLFIQTDNLDDVENGNSMKYREQTFGVDEAAQAVAKRWKQNMNVVNAASGFASSGVQYRTRLQNIDEAHEGNVGNSDPHLASSDPNIIAVNLASPHTQNKNQQEHPTHKPAPKLASIVNKLRASQRDENFNKSSSKLLKKVGGGIITSMQVRKKGFYIFRGWLI